MQSLPTLIFTKKNLEPSSSRESSPVSKTSLAPSLIGSLSFFILLKGQVPLEKMPSYFKLKDTDSHGSHCWDSCRPSLIIHVYHSILWRVSDEVRLRKRGAVQVENFMDRHNISRLPRGSGVKKPPAMQEPQVWFLAQEDPLKGDTETHSSILAWRILWTEESGGLQSIAWQRVGHDWSNLACTHKRYIQSVRHKGQYNVKRNCFLKRHDFKFSYWLV